METPITLPLWQFVLLLVLALWASMVLFLLPSARWFLRRRVNRVIERLDQKLHIRLQPFKMTKRRVLIDRLVFDPAVLAAMDAHIQAEGLPREVALERVERYAREIVPAFNAYAYFAFGYALSRRLASSLFRLRLGTNEESALGAIKPTSTVVFVMNHRSNMDYVMVSYLAASRTALSYAVGEWARIWPLQQLVRSMGAYFVRRRSKNALYRKVLERYVQMATASGVTQAIFPEGALSRDGLLGKPKLGLIDYIVRDFDPGAERDVVFVPVGLNYDRTFEDRTLLASKRQTAASGDALDGPQDSSRANPSRLRGAYTAIRFVAHNLFLMLRSKWFRFGYACVNFGKPISLKEWLAVNGCSAPNQLERGARIAAVGDLAQDLMDAIGKVVPVLPVALVAEVFLDSQNRAIGPLEIEARIFKRMQALESIGAELYVPRRDRRYAIECGLRLLTLRHLVDENDGLYQMRSSERPLLEYYANSIAHLDSKAVPDRE